MVTSIIVPLVPLRWCIPDSFFLAISAAVGRAHLRLLLEPSVNNNIMLFDFALPEESG